MGDARLLQLYPAVNYWVVPPLPLVVVTLQRLQAAKVIATVVVPLWKRQPFYAWLRKHGRWMERLPWTDWPATMLDVSEGTVKPHVTNRWQYGAVLLDFREKAGQQPKRQAPAWAEEQSRSRKAPCLEGDVMGPRGLTAVRPAVAIEEPVWSCARWERREAEATEVVPVGMSSKHMENGWNLQLLEVGRQAALELQQVGAAAEEQQKESCLMAFAAPVHNDDSLTPPAAPAHNDDSFTPPVMPTVVPMPAVELVEGGEVGVELGGDMVEAHLPAQQVLGLCDCCSAISMAMDKLGVPHGGGE